MCVCVQLCEWEYVHNIMHACTYRYTKCGFKRVFMCMVDLAVITVNQLV